MSFVVKVRAPVVAAMSTLFSRLEEEEGYTYYPWPMTPSFSGFAAPPLTWHFARSDTRPTSAPPGGSCITCFRWGIGYVCGLLFFGFRTFLLRDPRILTLVLKIMDFSSLDCWLLKSILETTHKLLMSQVCGQWEQYTNSILVQCI